MGADGDSPRRPESGTVRRVGRVLVIDDEFLVAESLRRVLADEFRSQLLIPPQSLATDNAAMIGIAGWQKFAASGGNDLRFGPQPDLRLTFS